MLRIPDEMLNCSLYLYPSSEDARNGKHVGGSGFIAAVQSRTVSTIFHLYAITNRHVIEEGMSVVRLNTIEGGVDILDLKPGDWETHNRHDLAAAHLDLSPIKHRVFFLQTGGFLTKESIARYGIGPGDDTALVGRFAYADGRLTNQPSVRFGKIAMNLGDPIRQASGHLQESFLVETHSIGGYSGSPVFVYFHPLAYRSMPRPADSPAGVTISLLGVDWGHLPTKWVPVTNRSGDKHLEGWGIQQNTGMMGVVPAWHILDLLEAETFMKQRDVEEEIIRQEAGVMDVEVRDENT